MRKYLSYLLCMLAAASLAGCRGIGVEPDDIPADARLQLRSTELVATRTAGVQDLNENLISQVQLFFSDNGEDILYRTEVEVNEADGIVEDLPLTLPVAAMESLFSADNTCQLFVVANAPAIPEDVNTVSGVKAESITLAKQVTAQDSFVMTGVATDITRRTDNSVAGSVDLKRVAAKIEVVLNVHKSIVIGDGENQTTWVSDINSEHMSLTYAGMTSSTVGGTGSADPYNFVQHDFDSSESTDDIWVVKQTVPFYSYPVSWDHNSENEIILNIPWKRSDVEGDEFKTYQYQIPVNYDDMELVSNYLYKITVNVSILGSLTGDVVVTPCSYVVVDWGTGVINTELSRPKYLVVDQNYVEMNNVNTYSVGYASSDAVTAVITKVTKPDYSGTNASTINIYSNTTGAATVTPGNSVDGNRNPFTVTLNGNQVSLSHSLVNDNTSSSFDYVPYEVTVKVTNETGFTEYIVFKQYPAVYVLSQLNTSQTTRDTWGSSGNTASGTNGTNNAGYGYVMVNSLRENRRNYTNSNNSLRWQTVESFDDSSYNPNMYVITTTSLDASLSGKYILGDSREVNAYTASQVGFTSATDVLGRTLESYRPTKTDRDDYLSPKFRISSAYGQLGDNTLNASQAKMRCAAYQEDGYPAGRWRLATYAELEFIAMLCAKDALPYSLFGASDYWSATGALEIDTQDGTVSKSNATSGFLRCVYDDWYWSSEQLDDKTKFVWGDESTTAEINASL